PPAPPFIPEIHNSHLYAFTGECLIGRGGLLLISISPYARFVPYFSDFFHGGRNAMFVDND
ncbi:MAG: hypothetical protein LBT26_04730, partial [Clostridiales Family XIII bacterium]|nr:hypothetical protein [Clostridiales Family XIII bacterium]